MEAWGLGEALVWFVRGLRCWIPWRGDLAEWDLARDMEYYYHLDRRDEGGV